MKKITKGILFSIIIASTQLNASGLPDNISELVEDSAPAVVNITSKKEVTSRQMGGYGGIPDEILERFGMPRQYGQMPQQKGDQLLMVLGLFLKMVTY